MMNIQCPKCGEIIPIEKSNYDALLAEVRTAEFNKEMDSFKQQILAQKKSEIDAARSEEKTIFAKAESSYKEEIAKLKADYESKLAKKDADAQVALSRKEQEISSLQTKLEGAKTETQLAVKNAVQDSNEKIIKLQADLEVVKKDKLLNEENIIKSYEMQMKLKDEQIEQIRDFKKKQSTKMIGEDLEQHCLMEFNKVRAYCFPNAQFDKDNKVVEGTKGDFVYRETTNDGVEVLSILFEMKNQDEDTKSKHKNEDFFAKMDSDRKKKNCEYAILVSTLEEDNDFYNAGIADISSWVPKGFVVRPQFFVPIIQILRNAALKAVDAKRELLAMQAQEEDLTNFENNLMHFKDSLGKTILNARNNHVKAVESIKDTIKKLQTIVELLETSNRQLDTCDNKLEDITVDKITKNAPSVKQKILELRQGEEK